MSSMKIIKSSRKKLKKTPKYGKTSQSVWIGRFNLMKMVYYQKQSTDSMQCLQNPTVILCRNKKVNLKIHI
jgi:hypothetical protein